MASAARLLEGAGVSFYVTFEGYITDEMGNILSPDEVERSLEAILDELLARGVPDATVGGTLARAVIEISVTVEAKSLEEAQAEASASSLRQLTPPAATRLRSKSTGWPQL